MSKPEPPKKINIQTDMHVYSYSIPCGSVVERVDAKMIKITKPDGTPRDIELHESNADQFMFTVQMFNGG